MSGNLFKEQSLIAALVILPPMFVCMLYDLRQREIPIGLTLVYLIGAGVMAILHTLWAPVILTVALIQISDIHSSDHRRILAGIALILAGIFQPAHLVLSLSTLAIWSFWDFGLIGGADTKLLIAVLLATSNPGVLIPIFLAGGIQGLIARMQNKSDIPFVVSIFLGSFVFLLTPLIHI